MSATRHLPKTDLNDLRLLVLADCCRQAKLTERQQEVWLAIYAGEDEDDVAESLGIAVTLVREIQAAAAKKVERAFPTNSNPVSAVTLLKCVRNRPEIERDGASTTPNPDYRDRPKPFGLVAGDLAPAPETPMGTALELACALTGSSRPRLTLRFQETPRKRTADELHAEQVAYWRRKGAIIAGTG